MTARICRFKNMITQKTKHGFDKMTFLRGLMNLLHDKNIEMALQKFYSTVEQEIKRPITSKEKINFLHGFTDLVMSDKGTEKRFNAINYIVELGFLIEPVKQQ